MTTSTSQNPDLDWTQVRETVRMLNLAVAQIEMSMKEGDDSVDTLTNVFTTMAGRVQVIENMVADVNQDESSQITEQCKSISEEMQYAILAFQFYDKLTQRLSHVTHSLDALSDLVSDDRRLFNPVEWSLLQEKIKSKYSMPAEYQMFEMIMQGHSVEDILKQAPVHQHNEDNIELF